MKAALIGHPVSHSKSAIIHHHWMKQYGIEGQYDLIDTPDDAIEAIIKKLIKQGYCGFNVTVPHKERVISFCDEIDEGARQIGAVNTVHIKEGKLYGYNTDVHGFVQNIKDAVPDFDMAGKTALVLGAGGAARGVLYGLLKQGVQKIYLSNRTIEKAEKIKNDFGNKIEIIEWHNRQSKNKEINLLVNTTSLGMTGKSELSFELSEVQKNLLVCDIVYNPLYTNLLNHAKEKQCHIVTGIGMLLYQAVPAFALWSGMTPEVTDALKAQVLA